MFKKLLLSTAAVVAMSGAALAADLPTTKGPPLYTPPPPIFTWTGAYIGGQVGYEWGRAYTVPRWPVRLCSSGLLAQRRRRWWPYRV